MSAGGLPAPATNNCGASSVGLCTDGPAIGDFKGAMGVAVLAITGNVLHNHHHWVTDIGDTIFFKDRDLTLVSTSTTELFVGITSSTSTSQMEPGI